MDKSEEKLKQKLHTEKVKQIRTAFHDVKNGLDNLKKLLGDEVTIQDLVAVYLSKELMDSIDWEYLWKDL